MEREHKFLVGDAFPDIARLRKAYEARGLELRRSAPREQTDVYYDTPALELLRAGIALRVRRYGDVVLATYKASGVVRGSLHAREELELPYTAPWPPAIMAKLATLGVLSELGPLLQLSTRRARYLVYGNRDVVVNDRALGNEVLSDTPLAELSLDEVSALHGAAQMTFKELELEAQPDLTDAAFAELASVLDGFDLFPHRGDKLSHTLTLLGLLPEA